MHISSYPDPPGTINPAKLLGRTGIAPDPFVEAVDTSGPPNPSESQIIPQVAQQSSSPNAPPSTAQTPAMLGPAIPLPRISSDWDLEHDIVVCGTSRYQETRSEFEDCHVAKRRPTATKVRSATARARRTSHRGYFRSQIENGLNIHVPVDLRAGLGATVVVDRVTASLYDAYLLRADIMKNVNFFRRLQIIFHPETKMYSLLVREGRVGLQGVSRQEMESSNLRAVANRFRRLFCSYTHLSWNYRYERASPADGICMFVELDYRGIVAPPKKLPDYTVVDAKVKEEVKGLMEDMLYGGSVQKRNGSENPGTSENWSAFSAPYEYLSPWTIFSAVKILEHIWKHLESGRPIYWKAILRASSRYRSQIPCCTEHDRVPVISSYHAIFIELKFLHSLRPLQDIVRMLTEIHRRGSLQLNAYKTLAQPLYQAYSSLRHGFRRLTDASTPEFQDLQHYLENSNNRTHHLTLELQDIYRVFVKANLPNPYHEWIAAKRGDNTCGEKRLLLWHGTPLDSLLGILDLGLQIRRHGASWTGTMFGNGIYLADASSKSAAFCKHHSWGGEAVLLLCEADVGTPRIRSWTSIANGHDLIEKSGGQHRCIEGLGRVGPGKWKEVGWEMTKLPGMGRGMVLMPDPTVPYSYTPSTSGLGFNEYVIYHPSHVVIRYLIRVKIKG